MATTGFLWLRCATWLASALTGYIVVTINLDLSVLARIALFVKVTEPSPTDALLSIARNSFVDGHTLMNGDAGLADLPDHLGRLSH